MNRAFLIHGWDGRPDNHWFPWLSLELKARGFEVNAPQMPTGKQIDADTERGYTRILKVKEWLEFLKDYVGKPDEDTYFVGHSLGCIAIARYVAGLSDSLLVKGAPESSRWRGVNTSLRQKEADSSLARGDKTSARKGVIRIGGCVFVAGFSGRINIPEIREFYELPFDAEAAKKHCDKFVMIFSDNDSYVPMEKSLEMARQLNAKTILERGKGHFCTDDGVTALPSALSALLRMSDSSLP